MTEIDSLRAALTSFAPGTTEWAALCVNLAVETSKTSLEGLNESITLNELVAKTMPSGEAVDVAELNLAHDLSRRYRITGSGTDLLTALELGESLLKRAPEELLRSALTNHAGRTLTALEEGLTDSGLDEAIALLEQALSIDVGDDEDWASCRANLSTALSRRFERDQKPEDIARAIELDRTLLARATHEMTGGVEANLANALHLSYIASGEQAQLTESEEWARLAVTRLVSPEDDANRLDTLAQILLSASSLHNEPAILAEGRAALHSALEGLPPSSPQRKQILGTLGATNYAAYLFGESGALEAALQAALESKTLSAAGSLDWVTAVNGIVTCLAERFDVEGNSSDLVWARQEAEAALDFDMTHSFRGPILANYALVLLNLYHLGDDRGLVDLAITAALESVDATDSDSTHLPARLNTLSNLLEERALLQDDVDAILRDIDEAINVTARCLSHSSLAAADSHIYLSQRSSLLAIRSRLVSDESDLDDAISSLVNALSSAADGSQGKARLLFTLGSLLLDRHNMALYESPDIGRAVEAFEEAAQLDWPDVAVHALQRIADIAIAMTLWDEAEEALDDALLQADKLTDYRRIHQDQERARETIQGVGATGAICALRSDSPIRAAVMMDRASSTLHARAMGVDTAEVDPEHLVQRTALLGYPTLYLGSVSIGTAAAIVKPDGEFDGKIIEGLTSDSIDEALGIFRLAFRPALGDPWLQWNEAVDELLHFVWDGLVDPLEDLIAEADRVAVVGLGPLAALPIGTARSKAGKTLLSSTTTVRIPGLSHVRVQPWELPKRVLVATDSGPGHRAIVETQTEGDIITSIWSDSSHWCASSETTELVQSEVRSRRGTVESRQPQMPAPDELRRLLIEANLIHLACHFDFDRLHPKSSTIRLGGPIDVADLFEPGSASATHIVMSSCDSGLNGDRLPDESLGPTTTLLEAGARSVTAALWEVDDKTAPRFMKSFHHNLAEGHDPAEALRRSQLAHIDESSMIWAPYIHVGS